MFPENGTLKDMGTSPVLSPHISYFWALPKTGSCFLFFGCKPKKKKHLSLIRENPRLMLYRFNPCPPCPQRKIPQIKTKKCELKMGVG